MKKTAQWRFEIKSVDDEQRVIVGMSTTPTPDRVKDVLDPFGARFAKSIPLFLYHDSTKSVGRAELGKPTSKGIPFRASIPKVAETGVLKDRVDEAWQMLKYELIDAVSVGFSPDEGSVSRNKLGGLDFAEYEILELSLVPIPMQPEAVIQHIKSIDQLRLAAPGRNTKADRPPPGASGTSKPASAGFFSSQGKGKTMQGVHERHASLREGRETKMARLDELNGLRKSDASAFGAEQRTEFDNLQTEIDDIDADLAVVERQVRQVATARPVETRGAAPYGFVRKQDPDDKFKGQAGTRKLIAKALASISAKEGNYLRPSDIAEMRWGKTNPMLVAVMKANEVAGGGSGSGEAWAELVSADNRYTGDFVEFLYSKTVYDRIAMREVPANVAIKGMDGAFTGYWVGESKAIPMSQGSGSSTSLTPLKVAALTVLSNELIRDSSPAAEMIVRDALEEAQRQRIDSTFLSVTAASAGVSPAGLLNGLSIGVSDGDDASSVATDIKALLANFITAKDVMNLQIVTTPTLSAALGLMKNALGQLEFPGLTVNGGSLLGYPVITGDNVGSGDFIMLNPREIWKIGDLGVQVSVSQEATIEQSTAPIGETDTPTAMTQAFTSMFQEESTAFKVVRPINFAKRRTTAVAYIGDANYGSGVS